MGFQVQMITELLLRGAFVLETFEEAPYLYSSCHRILITNVTSQKLLRGKLCLLEQDFSRVFKTQALVPTFLLHVYVSNYQSQALTVLLSPSTLVAFQVKFIFIPPLISPFQVVKSFLTLFLIPIKVFKAQFSPMKG